MIFDWPYALSIAPRILGAITVTIQAALLGFAIALLLGALIMLARRSKSRWLAWPVGAAAEFVRATPLLVQLYFLFFILPNFGVRLSPFATGVVGLGLHYATYTAEVFRAGLDSIPRGQWEAASALALPWGKTLRLVVAPQALPPVIPVLGNYLIAIFKETPLLSAITVLEMMQMAKIEGSETFQYLEPFTLVGVAFLALSLLASLGVNQLERRFGAVKTREAV